MSIQPKCLFAPALVVAALCSLPFAANGQAPTSVPAAPNPSIIPKDRLSEAWWANRHKAIVASLPTHTDSQILLVGDSITNDYETAKPPNQDFHPIWDQYYAPRKALNLGFSGDTTANVLWRLDHGEVDGLHPKVAVLLIGTYNTGFAHQTAEQTDEGIDAVVADIEHHLPDTKILLLGLLPTRLPSKEANFDVNSYLGLRYAGGKDPHVTYMDISVIFYQGGQLNDSVFYDGYMNPPHASLHPNTTGQRMMASAIEHTVARLMGDTAIKPAFIAVPPAGMK